MNGYGKVLCRLLIGSSQMCSNKKKPKPYYERGSKWKEAIWTRIFQNSNKQYDMQGSTTTTPWYSTNLLTDYQSKCTKISTPTSNPARTNSGDRKLFSSRKPLYTSEHDLIVGVPHLHLPQGQYSTISGGELPEIPTLWTPLKEESGHGW